MTQTKEAEALRAELDGLIDRAGLCVPEQRRADLVATYAGLKTQLALLRGRRPPQAEPFSVLRQPAPKRSDEH